MVEFLHRIIFHLAVAALICALAYGCYHADGIRIEGAGSTTTSYLLPDQLPPGAGYTLTVVGDELKWVKGETVITCLYCKSSDVNHTLSSMSAEHRLSGGPPAHETRYYFCRSCGGEFSIEFENGERVKP